MLPPSSLPLSTHDLVPPTLGVILAGGHASRLGYRDKALVEVGGAPLLARVSTRLLPQVARVILSANGDPSRFAFSDLPLISDTIPGFPGPLAGILAGFDWAAAHLPHLDWIVSVPVDCPFLPHDLVARLHAARAQERAPLACAVSGARHHHLAALWPVSLREDLRRALMQDGVRRVADWTARHGVAPAVWPDEPFDPFFNINTPKDVTEADRLAQRADAGP